MWENGVYKATPAMTAQDSQYWKQFDANGGQTALNQGYSVGADGKVDISSKYNQDIAGGTPDAGLGALQTGLQGVQALSGLASAYTGYKGLGLAEDQFKFQKDLAQTNLENQAALINENRLNSANVGLGLAGGTISDSQKQAIRDNVTASNVSSRI